MTTAEAMVVVSDKVCIAVIVLAAAVVATTVIQCLFDWLQTNRMFPIKRSDKALRKYAEAYSYDKYASKEDNEEEAS